MYISKNKSECEREIVVPLSVCLYSK